jgi:hypothetical protein
MATYQLFIFLKHWSLEDCAYHARRLDVPKLDIKRSVVSFGDRLEWDLRCGSINTPETVLVVQNHSFHT